MLGQRSPHKIHWSGRASRGGWRLSAGLKEVKGPPVTSEGKSEKENNTRRDPDGETLLAHTESGRKASLPGSRRPRRK